MKDLMKQIFGKSVSETSYTFPLGTPAYILYGYEAKKCLYSDNVFLVVRPITEGWNLKTIKNHIARIENLCGISCVVDLPKMTALQRTNLIENQIPFISGTGQIFLPFLGCYFEEKISQKTNPAKSMNATTQMFFLYIFYNSRNNMEVLNLTQIAKALNISKSTCTRALKQLVAMNLIAVTDEGVKKWLKLSGTTQEVINRALPAMSSPISKILYVRKISENIKGKICSIKALSRISMIAANDSDAGIAIDMDYAKMIPSNVLISQQDYLDFGGFVIEVWKYDPAFISEGDCVDDLSLFLELKDEEDERIQICLDEIRSKYRIEDVVK